MSKMIHRVQQLRRKAEDLKAAIKQIPPTVAEIRETVAQTTDQLQTLRSEVRQSIHELRADNDQRLSEALREINASQLVFLEAGFEVTGLDLEMTPSQRIMVHLRKLDDLHAGVIRSLMSANQNRPITHGILAAILQADEATQNIDLHTLHYDTLMVSIGAIPTLRIGWRAETEPAQSIASPQPPPPPPAQSQPSTIKTTGMTEFFAPRAAQPATEPADDEPDEIEPSPEPTPAPVRTPTSHAAAWSQETLQRFKQSPHYSKYAR